MCSSPVKEESIVNSISYGLLHDAGGVAELWVLQEKQSLNMSHYLAKVTVQNWGQNWNSQPGPYFQSHCKIYLNFTF